MAVSLTRTVTFSAYHRYPVPDWSDDENRAAFGALGPVIDRLVVHRHLSSAWNNGMDGLRRHLEEQAGALQVDAG